MPSASDNPPLSRLPTPLDRVGLRRDEPGLVPRLLADPATRVVVTQGERVLVTPGPGGPAVRLLAPGEATAFLDGALLATLGRLALEGSAPREGPSAPEGPHETGAAGGRDDPHDAHGPRDPRAAGVEVVLAARPPEVDAAAGGDVAGAPRGRVGGSPDGGGRAAWAGVREVLPVAGPADVAVVTTAIGLTLWHLGHGFCPTCGGTTEVRSSGWVRRCTRCGRDQFPRTDPAVIMAVLDPDGRLLLGRQARWSPSRRSVLAGFVEPGETLEDAVRRETLEEASVEVGEVEYRGSESWPMPRSLMLAFRGRALSDRIEVDGAELAEARWWTREELGAEVAAGRVTLPGRMSIARRLIEEWYGTPLPAP